MKAVGIFGTVKYGFTLILTVLLVILFGVGPAALGVQMFMDGTRQGILLILAGVFITYAGTLGLLYKVIADAVATGNKAAPEENDLSLMESYLEELEESLKNIEEKLEATEKDSEEDEEN